MTTSAPVAAQKVRKTRGLAAVGAEERLQGVVTSVRLFLTYYDLFFTGRRVIAAKAGSATPGLLVFGVAGALLTPGNPDSRLGRYAGMTPDQILSASRKNFQIPYESVERAVLDGGVSLVTLPTLAVWAFGKKRRFDFTQSMWRKDRVQLAYTKKLLASVLPGKVEFRGV